MKNKILVLIGIIALSLIIINMSVSHSKLSKTVDSKNLILMKTKLLCSVKEGTEYTFDYTGGEQTFEAPCDGTYKLETWGAQGGDGSGGNECACDRANAGAYVSGVISLCKDKNLYIYVGGQGTTGIVSGIEPIGGYNGGGHGNNYSVCFAGGGGGGATDIRLNNGNWDNFMSLKSRIMVAAGGSGGRGVGNGGLFGLKNASGIIGTQISGYKFGIGFDSSNIRYKPGTGGGYWTGSAAVIGSNDVNNNYDEGGSSSFISGHNGCVAITEDSTEDNIKQRTDLNGKTCTDGTTDITCSYHYSGYKFTDTVMIDGAGYNWTTVKGDYVGQPQPDGTITTGHSGNGYAKITYLGN